MNLIIKTLLIQVLQLLKYSQKVLMILSWSFLIIMLIGFALIAIENSIAHDSLWSLLKKFGFSDEIYYSGDGTVVFQVYFWASLIFYLLASFYYFVNKKPKIDWGIKKRFKLNFSILTLLYILILVVYMFLPSNKEDIFLVIAISFIISALVTTYYIFVSSLFDKMIEFIDSKMK